MRVLLLGGTAEARELAGLLAARRIAAVYSLAGVTPAPDPVAAETRIGGFGGGAGLANYLVEGGFTHLVDATHPFAAAIKSHADQAARTTGLPLIHLLRSPWGDAFPARHVPDLTAAARALPSGGRVFLAIGARHLAPFAARDDVFRLVRSLQDVPPRPGWHFLRAAPPFTLAEERALLRDWRIDLLVARDSGGASGNAKLVAAGALGVEILLIDRPPLPSAPIVGTVGEVLAWLEGAT